MTEDSHDMKGKICLITGATNGIGRIAAEALAKMGATVTLVGRNPSKTERVAAEIRAATGSDTVDFLLADLSSLAEVRKLAAAVSERYDRIDILINNAGAMFTRRYETVDGYERTFALNHLAYFLLSRELLPLLEEGAPARIVNIASGAHARGQIDFDDLQATRRFRAFRAYANSKLANILFTFELARRLKGKPITVNCLHPGFVRTGFGKNDGVLWKGVITLGMVFGRTPEKGAETIIYLASSPEVESVSGKYFKDCAESRCTRAARSEANAKRLWEESERLVDG